MALISKIFWVVTIGVACFQALELVGGLNAAESAPQQAAAAAMAAAWVIIPYVISRAVSELVGPSKVAPQAGAERSE